MKAARRRALESLLAQGGLPLTAIPATVRKDLEQWGIRTGTLKLVQQGRGSRLQVVNDSHFRALVRKEFPIEGPEPGAGRVHNLAFVRDTKAGSTRLDVQYLLGKTIGANPIAISTAAATTSNCIDLTSLTASLGCFALPLSATFPSWECDAPILLVENQILFDQVTWLPTPWRGILFYYPGHLSDLHLEWLARSTFSTVTLFPDYDAVGLRNFSRLHAAVPTALWHWEPDWETALDRYGNSELWLKDRQREDFEALWKRWEKQGWPDPNLRTLMEAMRRQGRMLEQEWVLAREA